MEAFHLSDDGALDMVHANVAIVNSVTKQCKEFIVSVITLARGYCTRNLATTDALQARALTPGSITSCQSARGLKRVASDRVTYRLGHLLH